MQWTRMDFLLLVLAGSSTLEHLAVLLLLDLICLSIHL
jgi:hypothetical protein